MIQQVVCVDCSTLVDLDLEPQACNCLDNEPRCQPCRESFDQFCAEEDCYEAGQHLELKLRTFHHRYGPPYRRYESR